MQSKKDLYQIGEVARLFHLSISLLRHYDKTGLVTPEYTDPDTGYRYYGTRQFELLNTIRYLRVLDFPLAQIKAFLDNRDTDVIEEKLVHQKEVIARKQKELELISRKIDHRLEQLLKRSFQDYDRIFLLLDQEDRYDGETETFPRQTCVTIRFCGSHREAPAYYQKLLAYIEEKKLCITGFSRETTLIDYGITNNTDKFVTEIQIPVNI